MKSNRERWRRWREADWGVLLRCLWVIPLVEFSVRWLPPRHWLPAATATGKPEDPSAAARGQEIARWVDAAYRRSPFSPTCLTRSLVLYRILRARRIPCQLRIGMRKVQGERQGHAWLDSTGALPEADQFEVIFSF